MSSDLAPLPRNFVTSNKLIYFPVLLFPYLTERGDDTVQLVT